MFLRSITATLSVATLLWIGCDGNQFDSPEPQVQPPHTATQPPVTDRETITPGAQLPRPETPGDPFQPVTPPADQLDTTPRGEIGDQPPAPTAVDSPAVEEVPVTSPPAQN
jgi:hypothetical protein